MSKKQIQKYQAIAKKIRKTTLRIVYQTKSPHLGSSFSMVDLLTALYFNVLKTSPKKAKAKNRDRFILSKGHGCPAFYATLACRGFISKNCLSSFAIDGGSLGQHPDHNQTCGIEVSTGSLGHGLSIASGMALAAQRDRAPYRTFVLLGDGELNEGSVWEAAMFASQHKLDNLMAIIDYNKLQIFGRTYQIMKLAPLGDKWRAFGWAVKEIDGHDFKQIFNALSKIPFRKNKPSVIIAHTVKAKGVSFMENKCIWHSKCPDKNQYQKALKEFA